MSCREEPRGELQLEPKRASDEMDDDDPRDEGPRDGGERDEALLRLHSGLVCRPHLRPQ